MNILLILVAVVLLTTGRELYAGYAVQHYKLRLRLAKLRLWLLITTIPRKIQKLGLTGEAAQALQKIYFHQASDMMDQLNDKLKELQ